MSRSRKACGVIAVHLARGIEVESGCWLYSGALDRAEQQDLLEQVRNRLAIAPPFTPTMPISGKAFSVRMSNFGPLGWHPVTKEAWPSLPAMLGDVWRVVNKDAPEPEACLVNYYASGARMGLHVDQDEAAESVGVVSVSLGDTAVFRLGGPERSSRSRTFRLLSGDVLVLGGASRRFYHGIDRVIPGSSTLMRDGGRINLTLRRVTLPVT
jgi:DNA oxidative demethylase